MLLKIYYNLKTRLAREMAYRKATREWNEQFPLLSFHPPYVSPDELRELDKILQTRRALRMSQSQ